MSAPKRGPGGKRPQKRRVRRLGDFTLVKEMGRGGMGVVYKARQESLGRFVALKVLPSFAGMDPAAVQRFRREAEACARLAHPGIVPVYGVGEVEGVHYYAMEMVDGPSLADLLETLRGRMPGRFLGSLVEEAGVDRKFPGLAEPPGGDSGARYARSCAALIADVANALAVAHASKIIHRDLKPSNVMIRSSGQVVLLDFGLARDEMEVGLTRSGDAVGTPSYMAPEQAAGSKDLDARVDIYGLGATLYELLTLEPPFDGNHPGEIMRKILDEEPRPVRMLNPRVPADLENIVHTCLAKDAEKRYPAIEALEMDLRAFLAGEDVEAKPPTRRERAVRFYQRNRKAAVVAAATLLVAGGIGLTAGIVGRQHTEQEGRAALADARQQLLEAGDVLKMKEHYGRALALLGDAAIVAEERRKLALEAFEKFYAVGDLDTLRQFFRSIPEAERAALAGYVEKVEGRGRLVLRGVEASDVSIRAFADGQLAAEWTRLPPEGRLALGDYLLRIESDGISEAFRRVTIERDDVTEIAIEPRAADLVPSGAVEVVDPLSGESTAISRTELSRRDYQAFLDSIVDPELLDEMVPRDWSRTSGGLDAPARGLSYLQARAAAAHLGVHLLSRDEYQLAATAGLPQRFPWGSEYDARRIAADPDQLSQPESVLGRPSGASPAGVQHLLGNVAEVLAPGADGALYAAGGHYQTDPKTLRLDRPEDVFHRLDSIDEASVYHGMRTARFLPRADQPEEAASAQARRDEIRDGSVSSLFHDWRLAAQGSVSYRLTVTGVHQNAEPEVRLPLATTGYLQMGNPTARDGHDKVLRVSRGVGSSLEESDLAIELNRAPRVGKSYRLQIDSWLIPAEGLSGEPAGYVLRVPVKAVGLFPTVHRVVLPEGARVVERDPAPTREFTTEGQLHLVWEFMPDARGTRTLPLVVRFRKDGMLTERWPVRKEIDAFRAAIRRGCRSTSCIAPTCRHPRVSTSPPWSRVARSTISWASSPSRGWWTSPQSARW